MAKSLSRRRARDFRADILRGLQLETESRPDEADRVYSAILQVDPANFYALYRRAILDYWSENEETLGDIVTHVLIHEIGHHFGFSDEDMARIETED